jgi:F0F1-type ATP synthase membrane subunit c/vacuolar-type H+-ATPase subunit K
MKSNKGNGVLIFLFGIAFIIAGFVVGLVSFAVSRSQATNPDTTQMFSTYIVGTIIAIILVVIGFLIIIFGSRSDSG